MLRVNGMRKHYASTLGDNVSLRGWWSVVSGSRGSQCVVFVLGVAAGRDVKVKVEAGDGVDDWVARVTGG